MGKITGWSVVAYRASRRFKLLVTAKRQLMKVILKRQRGFLGHIMRRQGFENVFNMHSRGHSRARGRQRTKYLYV